jgi:hypothetical protein
MVEEVIASTIHLIYCNSFWNATMYPTQHNNKKVDYGKKKKIRIKKVKKKFKKWKFKFHEFIEIEPNLPIYSINYS